jgi:hypothetical protein
MAWLDPERGGAITQSPVQHRAGRRTRRERRRRALSLNALVGIDAVPTGATIRSTLNWEER